MNNNIGLKTLVLARGLIVTIFQSVHTGAFHQYFQNTVAVCHVRKRYTIVCQPQFQPRGSAAKINFVADESARATIESDCIFLGIVSTVEKPISNFVQAPPSRQLGISASFNRPVHHGEPH